MADRPVMVRWPNLPVSMLGWPHSYEGRDIRTPPGNPLGRGDATDGAPPSDLGRRCRLRSHRTNSGLSWGKPYNSLKLLIRE
jgi:hypothetical protein